MNKIAYITVMVVLAAGVSLAQSSASGADSGNGTTAPGQIQNGTSSTMPVPSQRTGGGARSRDHDSSITPDTAPPSGTITDQQPSSSSGSSSSSMGTTGSTPGTADQSPSGNQSGTMPVTQPTNDSQSSSPQTPSSPQAESSGTYSSGSNSSGSSANGSSSNDMSGTSPHEKNNRGSQDSNSRTDPHAVAPRAATHVPDPGTEMNPAAVVPEATSDASLATSMLVRK